MMNNNDNTHTAGVPSVTLSLDILDAGDPPPRVELRGYDMLAAVTMTSGDHARVLAAELGADFDPGAPDALARIEEMAESAGDAALVKAGAVSGELRELLTRACDLAREHAFLSSLTSVPTPEVILGAWRDMHHKGES